MKRIAILSSLLILILGVLLLGRFHQREQENDSAGKPGMPRRVESRIERAPDLQELRKAVAKSDREAFLAAFKKLVARDPKEAAAIIGETGAFGEEAMRCLMQGWVMRDAMAAHRWAVSLPDTLRKQSALTFLCFAIAEGDPGRAVKMAQENQLGDANGTLRNLSQQWAGKDFAAARDWAAALPAGPQRDEICGRVAFARAEADPEEAARWLVEQIPAGPTQDEAVMSVLNRWLRRDPKAAAAWVEAFPDSDLKARAESEVRNATGG